MESDENEAKGITFMDLVLFFGNHLYIFYILLLLVVYFRKHGVSHLVGKDSVDSSSHQEGFEIFHQIF